VQTGTATGFTLTIKNAPQLVLVVNGVQKSVYAFLDSSLKDLRVMASLDSSMLFYFQNLPVSKFEEEYIFVKEITISKKVTVMSLSYASSSSGTTITSPKPAPLPVPDKPAPKPSPGKVPSGDQDMIGSGVSW